MKSTFHEDTLLGVTLALQYYGLLRVADVLKVQVKDVKVVSNGTIKVEYNHMRKRVNPGFVFYVPGIYRKLFEVYMNQLDQLTKPESRFLKNFVQFEYKRTKETGYKKAATMIKKACSILGKNPDGYTGHCMRRSAATNLADQGVSFVNLKRHGQWKSDTVVEGYIANSEPIRLERLYGLMPRGQGMTNHTARKANPYGSNLYKSSDSDSDDEEIKKLLEGPVYKRKAVKKPLPETKTNVSSFNEYIYKTPEKKKNQYDTYHLNSNQAKKYKVTEETKASEAMLSLETDDVTFLKAVATTEKKPNENQLVAKMNPVKEEAELMHPPSNLKSWSSEARPEIKETELPFMSQLTQDSESGSITLRRTERESEPETLTQPDETESSTEQSQPKDVLQKILDMKEYLKEGADFHNCTFNFHFGKE